MTSTLINQIMQILVIDKIEGENNAEGGKRNPQSSL